MPLREGADPDTVPPPGPLTVADLRHNQLFAGLSAAQYEWLARAGSSRALVDGEVLFAEGDPARAFVVLIEGELVITTSVDGRDEVLARHSTRDQDLDHEGKPSAANHFTGELPLLSDDAYIATATSVGRTRVALYGKDAFLEMIVRCPQVCQVLLPVLAWRIHASEAQAGHRATVNALGTLAAGLAHELNNPAAAVARTAKGMRAALDTLESCAQGWGSTGADAEREHLARCRDQLRIRTTVPPGALERAALEDALVDWFDDHDVDPIGDLADALVVRGVTSFWLDELADGIAADRLGCALDYLSASLAAETLATDVTEAGERISGIVRDTKAYTNLDRAPEQDVDLVQGIEATLTMLRPRLAGVEVVRDYGADLPRIQGFPSELNQVWTNLIDNAVDAMGSAGTLTIGVRRERRCAIVEITDSGAGIPADVLPRVFAPFFTTKDVGKGTGLGLHLVHRVVTQRHRGSIGVRSQPGATRFTVQLPLDHDVEVACAIVTDELEESTA
jgi:signal transduction histidine kinase